MLAACTSSEVLSMKLMECLVVQKELGAAYDLSSLLCGICFGDGKLKGKCNEEYMLLHIYIL